MSRFQDSYFSVYRQTEDYKSLNLKIELLEKQLKEAEEKHYNEKRIATEIIADLIALYLKAFLRDEAHALFERYGKYFKQSSNIKYIDLTAKLYYEICNWQTALEYFLKSEKIMIEVGDSAGLVPTYFNIGTAYQKKKETEKANHYLILAGYIAKVQGMKHELSQMAWAFDPLIEKIGDEKFMERGKEAAREILGE